MKTKWFRESLISIIFLFLASTAGALAITYPPLVINEFVADNENGLLDEDGTKQDWLEIYNSTAGAVSLLNWQLLDSSSTWVFPAKTIAAGGYLVVFCSDKNRTNPAAPLHTNFGLSKSGEYLGLKAPDGTVISQFTPGFPAQSTDVSYGRAAGGGDAYFPVPTPGAANGASVQGVVSEVTFSLAHGFYSSSQSLTLSCATPGAVIRYTTNNSTPTETNGTVYTAPLTIDTTKAVRARAFKTNFLASQVSTRSYIFLSSVLNQVFTPGIAPAGWPVPGAAQLHSQVMRYGLNTTLKAQYTAADLTSALQQIPSISLVTDQDNLTGATTGIYNNAANTGSAWERVTSAEYLPLDGSAGFQIDCGLRIRGGGSRGGTYPKHSFRLFFRGDYGAGKLNYPLHGAEGTDEFDVLDLRTEQNYHWANDSGTQNTAVREVFCRDLSGAMGLSHTRSKSVHLYLNGQYWGLYMTEENPQQDYAASYNGGEPEDYDVISCDRSGSFVYEVENGTVNAWQATWNLARACAANPTNQNYFALLGRNSLGVRVPSMPVYIDPEELAGYMLLFYYTGDGDAPLSRFLSFSKANNWQAFRKQGLDSPWTFIVHDAEHTLLAPSAVTDRINIPAIRTTANRSDFRFSNGEWMHEDLTASPEYRLKFADVAQRHLFNGGALVSSKAQPLFEARAAEINLAIKSDCVRWGTNAANHTYAQWNSRLDSIRKDFFPGRVTTLLGQLRTRGLFPNVDAPTFGLHGGKVSTGYLLSLSKGSQAGKIYYTLDGSDPRRIGGDAIGAEYTAPIPINKALSVRTRFRSTGGEWSALDEASFTTTPPAVAGKLVMSKLHYHAANPTTVEKAVGGAGLEDSDFDYLELMNITGELLDLSGVTIEDGVTFSFAGSPITTLAAGGQVIIADNAAALAIRHGSGLPIAGEYDGKLANSSENLRVKDGTGAVIVEFTFADTAPWPVAADGQGPALVLVNPLSNPAHGVGTNWQASKVPGGMPGREDKWTYEAWRRLRFGGDNASSDPAQAPSGDPDLDGELNLYEFVAGTLPLSAVSRTVPLYGTWTDPETAKKYQTLSWRILADLSRVNIGAVTSPDLQSWPGTGIQVGGPVPQGDGTAIVTFRDSVPLGEAIGGQSYMKISVGLAP